MADIKFITDEQKKYLFNLKDSDITRRNIIKWFAIQKETPAMFNTNDRVKLPKGKLFNTEEVLTTVGQYIFNLFIVAPFEGKIEYIAEPITGGRLRSLEAEIAQLVLDGNERIEQFADYLNRVQWLGYVPTDFMTPSLSKGIIVPNKTIIKRKKELLEIHKDSIKAGDPIVAAEIEKELVQLAQVVLKDDVAMDLYNSGAKSVFDTHYKSFNIMKGPVRDNANEGKYSICTSEYVDGIEMDEYHAFSDAIVYAAFSRAVGTQKGGYITKQMFGAFQSVSLDDKGSDCKSTKTLDILLTEKNYKLFLYRYIVEGGKIVRIDNNNIKSYIGKVVKLRSVMYCKSPNLCNKCAGDLYYNLDIKNIGLTVTKVGTTILNLELKKFHNTTVKTQKINFRDYIVR